MARWKYLRTTEAEVKVHLDEMPLHSLMHSYIHSHTNQLTNNRNFWEETRNPGANGHRENTTTNSTLTVT